MKTGVKIFLGILSAAGLGLASWGIYSYTKLTDKPKDDNTDKNQPVIPPVIPPTKGGTTITDPRNNGGFNNNNTPPANVIYSGFKIGQDIFARFPNGTNGYTSKMPGTSNIYKTYKAGEKIGTFLQKETGGMISVVVEEPGAIYGTNAKTIYVPDTHVYA